MDIPVDTREAVFQKSNFVAANYTAILFPLTKQMTGISLTRIQTNAQVFKVGKVK